MNCTNSAPGRLELPCRGRAIGSWRAGKPKLADAFEAFRGTLGISVHQCRPSDPEAKGLVESLLPRELPVRLWEAGGPGGRRTLVNVVLDLGEGPGCSSARVGPGFAEQAHCPVLIMHFPGQS